MYSGLVQFSPLSFDIHPPPPPTHVTPWIVHDSEFLTPGTDKEYWLLLSQFSRCLHVNICRMSSTTEISTLASRSGLPSKAAQVVSSYIYFKLLQRSLNCCLSVCVCNILKLTALLFYQIYQVLHTSDLWPEFIDTLP